ncbi:hypothetical protein [Synechococcus sp. CBW1107]|uniref:hypothetical protein n=1 Tax=Synechococcus sp. CBW1107 TaxID=2789857 RepID=UPI002AD59E84|nr:hypothetical protein [Synechococcus sp. CBW1107]CAK6697144.1 hypothetical protein ICNINCKA_02170 [Synechococcus sp. CBW1107]
MSEPPTNPSTQPSALGWMLALRWPIALVAAVGIGASTLGRILQEPIKIELVMKSPLPVAAQVDVGSIQTPLVVEKIAEPIRTAPIKTIPIIAKVTMAEPVGLASPLAVNVPELSRGIGVDVKGPVEAKVSGAVSAQVAGDVGATVRGDVDARVKGKVEVEAKVTNQLDHQRIRIGL